MAKRILAIGDIHGRTSWQSAPIAQYDHVVFVGDYVDGDPVISGQTMLKNLYDIIRLKLENPKHVTLLLGNHDMQYLDFPLHGMYSGFRHSIQPQLTGLFQAYEDEFQIAWQYNNVSFTHAGLSKPYATEVLNLKLDELPSDFDYADFLNSHHRTTNTWKRHQVGHVRGGAVRYGGVTNADITETIDNYLSGIHQVVGHSKVPDILTVPSPRSDESGSITYIDVLNTQTKFYSVEA